MADGVMDLPAGRRFVLIRSINALKHYKIGVLLMGLSHFPHGISVSGMSAAGGGQSSPPQITGTYYHVCPGNANIVNAQGQQIIGLPGNSGLDKFNPLDSILTAYNKCVSGAGDGIILWAYGLDAADSTSYLSSTLLWEKSNITVFGMSDLPFSLSPITITNSAFAPSLATIIHILGYNNSFYNMRVVNNGTTNPLVGGGMGAVYVAGNHNYFNNVHFDASPNLLVADQVHSAPCTIFSANTCVFDNCRFGNVSIPLPNTTDKAPITLTSGCNNIAFNNALIETSYTFTNATSPGNAIVANTASALSGNVYFDSPIVINHMTSAFDFTKLGAGVIGTSATTGTGWNIVITGTPVVVGYAKWDASGTTNKVVMCSAPIPSVTGGIVTAAS
jgi:hypothetical protein